ncbi:SCP2 sterol-binding domain-containing protein [Pseudomonas sp. RTC3]|uniref:ubiquinone biosynthesis accessory factor UbiJ n=1 Tax=unclassified Pseudomonas TaxID=196821 RepID=UPI002AB4FAC3|nr:MULTISPECIES: SCP2 sterol-binding domain-containing protein [unclassified Pseudomonas]MEB0062747.1 SCP2 sterol-binding domain-containing protein [Pseudomonas sp. RTC3]MDY7567619.1 SCP2 sterol-binding domain-containing protein [Pseudomonas sp. 5C2]MEB0008210.1 SCP2 sterol-binding domain-containing protein [Pseudomonas sp. RTB2]MEB0018426.1 SCP2 sterol-binding domain-containing protein [Pseudomonas sp. RTB3]MEB0026666.1 SCP2 sterol-binding domain-containing protein [Pseudomonas sp. MH9.2]
MLLSGLLASVELGINRVLRMDSTALPRLERLAGKMIAVDCRNPAFQLFILPSDEGLLLAAHWAAEADCTLRAPASSLLRLALSQDKTAVLHGPEVELEGDSAVLLELVGVLQDLELDWEYELSRWLGPVASPLLGGQLRSSARWTRDSLTNLTHNLADYLSEESRTLVGQREAEARFAELDQTRLDLERLEARFERLALSLKSSDNA